MSERRSALSALALVALLLGGMLVPIGFSRDPVFWDALMNAAHAPLFGLVTLLVRRLHARRESGHRRIVPAIVVASTLAAAIELVQPYVGRSASLMDWIYGTLGAAAAGAGIVAWRWSTRRAYRVTHVLLCTVIAGFVLGPVVSARRAIHLREQSFPTIADFERGVEIKLWSAHGGRPGARTAIRRARANASSGDWSLHVEPRPGGWPGVAVQLGRSVWREYRSLEMDVFNPNEAFDLTVRVDDRRTRRDRSRFQRSLTVLPGRNRLAIPVADILEGGERPLDPEAIVRIVLYVSPDEPLGDWYLDLVRLVGQGSTLR